MEVVEDVGGAVVVEASGSLDAPKLRRATSVLPLAARHSVFGNRRYLIRVMLFVSV